MRTVRVTEVVGISAESWDAAGRAAVAEATRTVRGLQAAEVVKQDLVIEDGVVVGYRVRLAIAFDPSLPAPAPTATSTGARTGGAALAASGAPRVAIVQGPPAPSALRM
ncbi:dodecin family protein [Pseudonocardia lacus]|uniref:dodecin family protein n=1 Tax=Pseudonocardia lacus TaxID=2835865 RepID=UPI001BDCED01|nr:dodecin family protein [Pseudonocardia lacus]